MSREASRRRERRGGAGLRQLPWRNLRNPYKPIEVLSADHLEAIHQTSLRILEEHGMEFLDAESLGILKAAGADVTPGSNLVRFDRGLIIESIAKAPREFTLHARNPQRNLTMGGNNINFASVASAPNVSDLDRGRRPGNFEDYCNLLRLCQTFNVVQLIGGYPVEPADIPPATRHLDAHHAAIRLTDRVWHPYSLGKQRISDAIGMIKIARGFISDEQLRGEPSLFSIVNSNSPRRLDGPMLQGLLEMARHGQPVVLTPFTLSGAMAPATVAGALAQQNAEALAGISLIQIVAPGRALHVWRFHVERGHEDRRPGLRHAGIHQGGDGRRPARPQIRHTRTAPPMPAPRIPWTPRPPMSPRCPSGAPSWATPTWCSMAPAGWRAGWWRLSRSWFWMPRCCRP